MTATKPTVASILRRLDACEDAVRWAKPYGDDRVKAWRECENGEWMLWLLEHNLAKDGSPEHRKLVGCCSEIARTVLHLFEEQYPDDKRPRECLDVCDRFAAGKATLDELAAAGAAAGAAAWAAAGYAARYAAGAAAGDARAASLKQSANIVRKRYPRPPSLKRLGVKVKEGGGK